MASLDRYVFFNFFKIFTVVSFTVITLTVIYSTVEFLFGFKVKDKEIFIDYVLILIPLSFYILSPVILSISLLILFRRIFSKKIDLTCMSFGISPLRFSLTLLIFSFLLSLMFLLLNENFFPKLLKQVWFIEKTYKKKQAVDGSIVKNIWFIKEIKDGKYFTYIGNLDIRTGSFTDIFLLKVSRDNRILEIIEGFWGVWEGNELEIVSGRAFSVERKEISESLNNFKLKVDINVKEVRLFAEKLSHMKISELYLLYSKGSRVGIDTKRYISEILYRINMSFFPFILSFITLYILFRFRNVKAGFSGMFIGLLTVWTFVSMPKLMGEKAGINPFYSLIFTFLILALLLKGIHNLGKGFRV